MARRALFLANTDWYLWNFRLPLLRAMRDLGWEVILATPSGTWASRLAAEGFRWIPFDFARHGMNPWSEFTTIVRLVRLYRRERPVLVHHFTIKCVLYGGLAARLFGIRAVNSVTGLGTLFTNQGRWPAALLGFVRVLYRLVLARSHVIFENPDDLEEFRANRLLDEAFVHVIRGAGVDVAAFTPAGEAPPGPATVILVARLLHEKGLGEFVTAARRLRRAGSPARFVVAGGFDPDHPSSIDAATFLAWKDEGIVEFLGHRDDVREWLQRSHVACLPSWREGTPSALLEAMACGLPVVTTDVPGCREVTRPGDNGFLVPPRNPEALAQALKTLIEDPELRLRMGGRSRERATQEFSHGTVVDRTMAVYGAALSESGESIARPAGPARTAPAISVITVALNAERTIRRTIESVLEQTRRPKEHILVDGGSTDRTLEIAREFGDAVKIITGPDGGIYEGMNRGLAAATGDVVGFLNANDAFAHERVLERLGETFLKGGIDACYGHLDYVSTNGRITRRWRSTEFAPGLLRSGWMPPHPTFYCRRELLHEAGGFKPRYRIAADYALLLQLLAVRRIRVEFIPEVLVNMETGGVSSGSLRNVLIGSREVTRAWRESGLAPPALIGLRKVVSKIGQLRVTP